MSTLTLAGPYLNLHFARGQQTGDLWMLDSPEELPTMRLAWPILRDA